MAFNLENKITYKELAPSLQQLIDSKASITQYNECNTMLIKLTNQLNSNRISINNNGNKLSNLQNNKEILLLTTNNVFYSYSNGWHPTGGVYS